MEYSFVTSDVNIYNFAVICLILLFSDNTHV